jgi:hypothetical protein
MITGVNQTSHYNWRVIYFTMAYPKLKENAGMKLLIKWNLRFQFKTDILLRFINRLNKSKSNIKCCTTFSVWAFHYTYL